MHSLVVINAVGLTPALLKHAPRLSALAQSGKAVPMQGVFPAVTLTAQASMLTGTLPRVHGAVGNGWFWRELGEVRFWVQANRQMQRPPVYELARERAGKAGNKFTCAKLFWWFNQGAQVDWRITPKPHYGADGSKVFDIQTDPPELADEIEREAGPFPFFSFWGPRAGLPATEWIARASAKVIRAKRPTLTLAYLPHLDYDLQRFGLGRADITRLVAELDASAAHVLDAAKDIGARVLVVSEYGITDVSKPVLPNLALRSEGLLTVRDGPFGEMMDTMGSRALAVCDHQCAHVYVRDAADIACTRDALAKLDGVASVLDRAQQAELGIDHPRSGDLVLLSARDAWFAYPYWRDDARAPDFARTIDIHRKPGYDPCELFIDPQLKGAGFRAALTLAKKKIGMRYLLKLIPLDPALVRGSHGLPAATPEDGPLLLSDDAGLVPSAPKMTDVAGIMLRAMGL